jgi:phosphatidyl-myo-inositol dimannoside synthase
MVRSLQIDLKNSNTMKNAKLCLSLDSLHTNTGGIARVNRLIMKTLIDTPQMSKCKVIVYSDKEKENDFTVKSHVCGKSKLKNYLNILSAKFTHTHFLYGFIGLARMHTLPFFSNKPFMLLAHGIEVWPEWVSKQKWYYADQAKKIVSISQYTKNRAIELRDTFSRSEVCWLATEEDELPNNAEYNPPPRVLIVGRIEEDYKGHKELIDCWPRVVSAVPNATLSIAGRGPKLEHFQKLAEQSSASKNIEFLGFVPDSDMPKLWEKTAIFAMPSKGEGFGLVYIEAMRYGIPVIASIHDAGNEVNQDGVSGYNVNRDQPEELPERIIHLLKNIDLAKNMGRNGQERWNKHFRYSAFRERFLPIVDSFLS